MINTTFETQCNASIHLAFSFVSNASQTLYFLSSFFNQFGPNCTTFLVAAEVYPTDVRGFFHVSGRVNSVRLVMFPLMASSLRLLAAASICWLGAMGVTKGCVTLRALLAALWCRAFRRRLASWAPSLLPPSSPM